MCGYFDGGVGRVVSLRRLAKAEHVNHAISGGRASSRRRVLAAPVAEDVPGDLRRTPDEEFEAPDVRVVVSARRGREEDGAPPQALPTAHTAPFIPVRDKQATLLLKVYEGSCFEIANCFWRAEATISLPTDVVSRFDVTCEVTFALGIDGALEMSAASSKKSGGGVYDSKRLETSLRSSALSRVDLLAMSARLGYASLFERLVVHWRQGTLVRRAATAAALLFGAAWMARGVRRTWN